MTQEPCIVLIDPDETGLEIVEHFAEADMSSIHNKFGHLMSVMRRFQISGGGEKKSKEERGEMGSAEGAGDQHTVYKIAARATSVSSLSCLSGTFDHITKVIPGVTSMSSVGTLTSDVLQCPGPRKSIHSFMRISKLHRGLIMEMLCAQRPDLHEKIKPLMLELETLYQGYETKKKTVSRLTTGRNESC
jgi:hypothetical protein